MYFIYLFFIKKNLFGFVFISKSSIHIKQIKFKSPWGITKTVTNLLREWHNSLSVRVTTQNTITWGKQSSQQSQHIDSQRAQYWFWGFLPLISTALVWNVKISVGSVACDMPLLIDGPIEHLSIQDPENPQDQHLFDQPTVKQYATTWWPAGRLVRQPINTQSKGWDVDEHTQRPLKAVQCPVTETLHSGGEAHNLSAEKRRSDAY